MNFYILARQSLKLDINLRSWIRSKLRNLQLHNSPQIKNTRPNKEIFVEQESLVVYCKILISCAYIMPVMPIYIKLPAHSPLLER